MRKLDLDSLSKKEVELVEKIWKESSFRTYPGAEIFDIYISDSGENIFINGKTNKHGNTALILYLSQETNAFELGKMFNGGTFTPISESNMFGVLDVCGQVKVIFTFNNILGAELPTEKNQDDDIYFSMLEINGKIFKFVCRFDEERCEILNPQNDSALGDIYVRGSALQQYEKDFVNMAYRAKSEEEAERKAMPGEIFNKVLKYAILEEE